MLKTFNFHFNAYEVDDGYWAVHRYIISQAFFCPFKGHCFPLKTQKMMWSYPSFVSLKLLEFPLIHASNLEFH